MKKEGEKLRIWDPPWRNQTRVQVAGDSNLVVILADWMMEDEQAEVQS